MNENIYVIGAKNTTSEQISLACEKNENKVFFLKEGGEKSWNKSSPFSARSNLLQVKNLFEEINKTIVIYDSRYFIKFNTFDIETVSRSIDSMILGYTYISSEIIKTLSEQGSGDLVFVFLDDEQREKSIMEKVGEASFIALAEGIATKKASKQLGVSLIKADVETFDNNMDWFFSYLENSNAKKAASMPKHAVKWVKVGSKAPVILPFGK